jgi:hypothetical protein
MMNFVRSSMLVLLSVAALAMGGPSGWSEERDVTQTISKAEIEQAARKRVVFGHQSVGWNILEGATRIAREQGVALNVVETRRPPAEGAGVFHFGVGANGDPQSKIDDYVKTVGIADFPKADVALMKLCYVDMNGATDGVAVAKSYISALEKLQQQHPATRFVAVTSPLTTVQRGPKAWVKGLMGRSTGEKENEVRQKFNEYLRSQFGPGRVFDIAKIESEGSGTATPSLRGDLTNDGGHLNEKGQRLAGAAFLKLLAAPAK